MTASYCTICQALMEPSVRILLVHVVHELICVDRVDMAVDLC